MSSFEPIIRMNENAFRDPEKIQSKRGRKPLGDVTNSSKPLGKDKSSAKNFTGFKAQQQKVQLPKAGRKPLGDLTNSNKPLAHENSSKKNYSEILSVVNKEHVHSSALEEGFLHDHNECIKAQEQSMAMSLDYLLEIFELRKDSSELVITPELSPMVMTIKSKLTVPVDELELELMDDSLPSSHAPKSPSTPKSPASPYWTMDWKDLELLSLKLKDSPTRD